MPREHKSLLREASRQPGRFHAAFLARVQSLRDFHSAHGRYPDPSEGAIGQWAASVRSDWEKYPEDRSGIRASILEGMDGWTWEYYREAQRKPFLKQLADWYLSTDGIADPSTSIPEQVEMSRWIDRNRVRYHNGVMTKERVSELESIPFWRWTPRNKSLDPKRSLTERELSWMLDNAIDGRARAGGITGFSGVRHQCDIVIADHKIAIEHDGRLFHADKHEEDSDKTLDLENAGWTVLRIRESPLDHVAGTSLHVSKSASMQEIYGVTIGALRELGVSINPVDFEALGRIPGGRLPHYDDWYSSFEAFQTYIAEGGTSAPIATQSTGEFKVGQWVYVQRRKLKRGQLSEVKRNLLESIPGWKWELKPQVKLGWDESYRRLIEYQREHGSMPTALFRYDDGLKLGSWASYQRYSYRKGELTAERVILLEQVPGWHWEK